MRKAIVIAVREYQAAVRTKAFIVTLVAMPILMGGSIVVQTMLRDRVDTRDKTIAVLDHTGQLFDAVVESAQQRDANEVFDGEGDSRRKVKPRFLIERATVTASDPDRIILELSDSVRAGEIFGFVIIGKDALNPDVSDADAYINYHSNTPTYSDFQQWVTGPLNHRIQELRLAAAELDSAVVRRAMRSVAVANLGLVSLTEAGDITKAKETHKIAKFLVPFGLMMLMFMTVMVSATPLTQSVLEEKMQRIAEVLLGSIEPFQLMMGKLVGTVGVALTLSTFYLGGTYIALHRAGFGEFFPAQLIWWFVLFVTLAVFMYGSLFIAIGAAVTDLKEQQSMMTPVTLLVVSPMFVWLPVLREPNSTFAQLVSLFPPATPMLMMVRQAVPPGIPLWEPLAGAALVALTTIAFVFAAGRIFRVGILMQGRGANFADLFRWIVRG